MSDAKALTTADVGLLQPHTSEDGGFPGVVLVDRDDLIATTRALETAVSERTREFDRADMAYEACRAALARAEKAEQAERELRDASRSALARVAELERERDEALSERDELVDVEIDLVELERERDEARARVSALETALLDACREKVVHGHTTTLLVKASRLEVPGIKGLYVDVEQIRSEAKTLVAELVEALAGLERRFIDPKPGDPGGSCWCDPHRYLELQGHEDACEQARAALAKAKGMK